MDRSWTTSRSLLAGAAAAIGASACCAGPLLLVLMGVGGACGSRLAALEAYQPWFVGVALVFFGLAFHRLYRRREACGPGEACAAPAVKQRQGAMFWVMAAGAAALIGIPFYAPLLY